MGKTKSSRSIRDEVYENKLPNQTVSELLLEYLKLEKVEKIFGIPGGAVIFITDQLKLQREHIDFIICRQETGAAYIADGYYRVTGKLGVVLTTAGPSAINALTGSMNAEAGNSAMLTITGEVPEKYFGKGYLQEGADAHLDVNAVYKNAVQSSALIPSASSFQTLIEQALRNALSLPRRAAHLSIPNNIAGSCIVAGDPEGGKTNEIAFPKRTENYRTLPSGVDTKKIREAFDSLKSARKPLIFLGNGARGALREKARLARFTNMIEHFGIPVMTTPDGKGIFSETHSLSLRNYGMTPCLWPEHYMKQRTDADHFDALLVIGSSLGELATSPAATSHYDASLVPTNNLIQIDLDQSVIGRSFPTTMGIVADAGAAIDGLCDYSERCKPEEGVPARVELISTLKSTVSPFEFPAARNGNSSPIHPAAAMRVINDIIEDGHIFIDAGNCVGWSLNNMVITPPNQFHIALGMGPMGFAVGAVVGGKIGAPDKDCVAVVGDGAFMMQGSEISTAAQNRVGAVWVVLYNNDLAMVSQGMGELFEPAKSWDDYYQLGSPDLVKYSEGLGADAVAISEKQGPRHFEKALVKSLKRARKHNKPQVIVLHIDTRAMPKFGWPHLATKECH